MAMRTMGTMGVRCLPTIAAQAASRAANAAHLGGAELVLDACAARVLLDDRFASAQVSPCAQGALCERIDGGRRTLRWRAACGLIVPPLPEPQPHASEFTLLLRLDVIAEVHQPRNRAILVARQLIHQHVAHVNSPLVVRDHAAHEIDRRVASEADGHALVHPCVGLVPQFKSRRAQGPTATHVRLVSGRLAGAASLPANGVDVHIAKGGRENSARPCGDASAIAHAAECAQGTR
mmetsp:Transcript_104382/g.319610  ORF Transcript_104382/g.319610 Transcript_104382/m.319610 type:complete len:235 (-) Transcript_104382:899-1603(-)